MGDRASHCRRWRHPGLIGSSTDILKFACVGLVLSLTGCAGVKNPARQNDLWATYNTSFVGAKYIDLTHAFAPGDPKGVAFGAVEVRVARSVIDVPGFLAKGDAFTYEGQGAAITAYNLPTDQIGTQLDPPAHGHALGATISDLPATFALRPLVVIDVSAQTLANAGYIATVADIAAWEGKHGTVPEGSVVMFRTDWSKKWGDPKRFTERPFPGIALDALKLLHLGRKILFHGHEPLDTDMSFDFAAERWLLTHDFAQAEGVANLDQVPEAGALIVIGFAKPMGGSGGLARFIAIAPATWKFGTTIAQMPGAPLPRQPKPLKRGADNVLRP